MILKDRLLTQSPPDICHKLQKQVFGPNQSLEKCCSWLRRFIMVENMRRKNWDKKEPGKRMKPQQRLLDLLWNSLRKFPRAPRWKGTLLLLLKKGGHLKQDFLQASKPPPALGPVCKGPHWRRDCLWSVRLSRQSGLKVPRVPHTSSHPNYTWGTPGINNCGGPTSWLL